MFKGISFKERWGKYLWASMTICSLFQYGCVRRIEKTVDRWAFFFVNHAGLFLIIFAIIVVIFTILEASSQKTCPDCFNKKVPKQAKVCQTCGYRFSD